MVRSMTGFGRGESTSSLGNIVIEMKSVNHRYLDVAIRLPKELSLLEEELRTNIRQAISRGRIDVFVKFTPSSTDSRSVSVNLPLALAYLKQAELLKQEARLDSEMSVAELLRLPEVIQLEETELDLETMRIQLKQAATQAITGLLQMRVQEGERLASDMQSRVEVLVGSLSSVEKHSPLVVEEYRQKLATRMADLLQQGVVDSSRLAQEVAIFADRACISEEIVRLRSHFQQFGQMTRSSEPVGRKLDFLLQEMNREINTIGSKANDAKIALLVVEMKSELEKIREQAQNIE